MLQRSGHFTRALAFTLAGAMFGSMACNRALDITRPSSSGPSAVASAGTSSPAFSDAVFEWRCVTSVPPFDSAQGRQDHEATDCPRRLETPSGAATAITPPETPFNVTGTISNGRVTLTWQQPTTGDRPTAYVIEAGSSTGRLDQANFDTGSAVTTVAVDGVPAGTYYVRVRAKNAAGTSAASTEIVLNVPAPCLAPPDAPTSLTARVSGYVVSLSWTAPVAGCAPASYSLEAGLASGRNDFAVFDTRSMATAYTADGVDPSTYYVRVRGIVASRTGAASNEVIVTVVPAPLTLTSFVSFGDSITSGESGTESGTNTGQVLPLNRFRPTILVPVSQRYPTVLQQRLVARYPTQTPTVANQGLSGEAVTDPGTISRLAGVLNGGQYSVVLILEGTNDLHDRDRVSITQTINGLRQMLRVAWDRTVRPYLATIPPINPFGFRGRVYAWEQVGTLNSSIRALASAEGVTLVDVNQAFNNNYAYLGSDGLHPNAAGYAKIAETFYSAITSTLEGPRPTPTNSTEGFLGRTVAR